MTNKYNQQLLKIAQQRFENIDWELPPSREEVDELYDSLPMPRVNETVPDWLDRVANPITPIPERYPSSYITRLAAADGQCMDVALESDDGKFRLTIVERGARIYIKAEALGKVIEDYANRLLKITSSCSTDYQVAIILDDMAEGEIEVVRNDNNSQLFFGEDTLILNVN